MADVSLKIGADAGLLRTGLSQAQNSIASFAASATKQLAGALSFTAVSAAIGSVIQKAGQLQDISDRFGVSAEAIQRIGNVAAESGGSIQDVATALARIGAAAQEAASGRSKELVQTFADIGVSGQELVRLSPEQLFYRLANAMNDGSLAGKDLATAKALLGRGFQTLLPVLRMTEQQIMAIGEATGVMTDAQVDRLDRFGDSWGRLKIRGMNALAALTDGMIRLGEEIVKNPMALATGDWDKLEKGIQDTENRDRQNAENRRQAISGMNAAAEVTDTAESTKDREKQEKALEELKAGFRKTFRAREKRLDDEAHQDRMKQIDAELAKMDEAQRQREQERGLAARGLDALIGGREQASAPASAIASSLQQIGGGGAANLGGGTADTQLEELRRLRDNLTPLKERIPQTLEEIRNLLAQNGGTLP